MIPCNLTDAAVPCAGGGVSAMGARLGGGAGDVRRPTHAGAAATLFYLCHFNPGANRANKRALTVALADSCFANHDTALLKAGEARRRERRLGLAERRPATRYSPADWLENHVG